jgi:hypothetical protein
VTTLSRRLTAQLLAGRRARDPVTAVARLLAVQGQDGRGARLAIRARTTGVGGADIDRALTDERSLVITWLNRGTLHLVTSEDYFWLHAVTTPPLAASSRTRLAQNGISPAQARRAIALVRRELAANGPMTGPALRERLRRAAIPTDGQAFIHVMFAAALDGAVVRGPMIGRQHAYALAGDWLPPGPAIDRAVALSELARRYLAGHGPANDADLARWAGLPLRDARAGLQAIAGELAQTRDGLVDLKRRSRAAPLPPPRLLGAFEPVLLGWCSRADLLAEVEARVVTGGVFRGFALVDGRAAALWRIAGHQVAIEPLVELGPATADALAGDGRAVLEFLGLGSGLGSGRP